MKKLVLSSLFLGFAIISSAQNTGGGGEYVFPKQKNKCLANEARDKIKIELKEIAGKLEKEGKLTYNKVIPQFIWPVQQASGFNYEDVWSISNFVDHDISTPNSLSDYNCGTRTYDTQSGYNHQGTDIFLWPFSWNQFQDGQAEVVAAAPGTIIQKYDGNFDMNCSFNSSSWNAVYIQHSDGSIAWYGHMKNGSLTTKGIGSSVIAGEYLGKIGSSGSSTGPHLHFEVYDNLNNLIDPFAGPCNNLNTVSWWASQIPYSNPNINALMTHYTAPQFNSCPLPDYINDTNYFSLTDIVFLASYFRDQVNGTTAYYNLYKPGGSLYLSWDKTFTNDFQALVLVVYKFIC